MSTGGQEAPPTHTTTTKEGREGSGRIILDLTQEIWWRGHWNSRRLHSIRALQEKGLDSLASS